MTDFECLEPAIDPNNRIAFLLDWELTMKCNLDCSYCNTGIYGGHDNTTNHPPLAQCIGTIDFMFQYVDLYMQRRPAGLKHVILNVYGGESLHHPNIVDILQQVQRRYTDMYRDNWHLTVTTTTNAIITLKKLQKLIPLIDEFTVSYHSENSVKQKDLFRSNVKHLQTMGKRVKCIVLMHPGSELFADSQQMIEWCQQNQVKCLPRQLDHGSKTTRFNYLSQQVIWFDQMYKSKAHNSENHITMPSEQEQTDLSSLGRACCGGRSLCKDQSYKTRDFYTANRFPDWYCSVNQFFLYIKQVNGEIYTNKDCKMNYDGTVGPIGTLDDAELLLDFTRRNLEQHSMPVIQCKKTQCWCGLCAPKAKHRNVFDKIMEKYQS